MKLGVGVMNEEMKIIARLRRRLESARASVMLEFAVVAPLAIAVVCFAADFTRILRTEQQLEIATRVMADVECHMVAYEKDVKSPSAAAKKVGKYYLLKIANVVDDFQRVKVKGGVKTTPNPFSVGITYIDKFLKGNCFEDSPILKLLCKMLGSMVNFLTFRTFDYLTNVSPRDREIYITSTAVIPTLLPSFCYSWWGDMGKKESVIGVGQFAPDRKDANAMATAWADSMNIVSDRRHRVYCHMPVIDTAPIAPETYVRHIMSWFKKWL